jgi:hypothetical protein
MRAEIFQRKDGTVLKIINDQWFYLSPLFGEWLPIFNPSQSEDLKPYPRNIEVHSSLLENAIRP